MYTINCLYKHCHLSRTVDSLTVIKLKQNVKKKIITKFMSGIFKDCACYTRQLGSVFLGAKVASQQASSETE